MASKALKMELEGEFVDETGPGFDLSLEFVHFHHPFLVETMEKQGEEEEEGEEEVEAMEEVQEEEVEAEGYRKSEERSARSGSGSEPVTPGSQRLVSCHQIH